jgi:hypothetical protein
LVTCQSLVTLKAHEAEEEEEDEVEDTAAAAAVAWRVLMPGGGRSCRSCLCNEEPSNRLPCTSKSTVKIPTTAMLRRAAVDTTAAAAAVFVFGVLMIDRWSLQLSVRALLARPS